MFPARMRLCRVREVRGDYVSFCLGAAGPGGMCTNHKNMRRYANKKRQWDGLEVAIS